MEQVERLPQDDRELREAVRSAREQRGMLPQQVAAAAGVAQEDVEFIETHGVAVNPSMLAVLDFFGIRDYESEQMARLAELIPGGRGGAVVKQLVEGGYKSIEAIEDLSEDQLLGLPWFDLGQLGLLRQGLRMHRSMETADNPDES